MIWPTREKLLKQTRIELCDQIDVLRAEFIQLEREFRSEQETRMQFENENYVYWRIIKALLPDW